MVHLPSYMLVNLIDLAADTGAFTMGKTKAKKLVTYSYRTVAGRGRYDLGKPSTGFAALALALACILTPKQIVDALLEIQYTPTYLEVLDVH